jgi:CubicO group peptidase (beta-lactamase class C family)
VQNYFLSSLATILKNNDFYFFYLKKQNLMCYEVLFIYELNFKSLLSMKKFFASAVLLSMNIGVMAQNDLIKSVIDGSFFNFPQIRESVCDMRMFFPTKGVKPAEYNRYDFKTKYDESIAKVMFETLNGELISFEESLDLAKADGIIVLHKGKIVFERYYGFLEPDGTHAVMSVSKTLTGTLGAVLVAEGILDENKKVSYYVEELSGSAFGSATIRELLDMTTALDYDENYNNPNSRIWEFSQAGTPYPKPEDYTGAKSYREFLQTVKQNGKHGQKFAYKTINTDALAWVITKVCDKPLADLISERFFKPMGAHIEGYYQLDATGTEFAGGGFNAALRDLAAFGEMIRNDGFFNGKQIIPQGLMRDIIENSNANKFDKDSYPLLKGWAYRNMWWVMKNSDQAFCARGVHGQVIYINPVAETVIVRLASHPEASNSVNDPFSLPAYQAVADYLKTK